jgi:endo-1,4-beta-xylanase
MVHSPPGLALSLLLGATLGSSLVACAGRSIADGAETPASAAPGESLAINPVSPSLAAKYAALFPIGAAVDPASINTHAALLKQHFNSITLENEMKPESLAKAEGVFDFSVADQMVATAKSNGMRVRGHTLLWHRQTPDWFFKDAAGNPASKEVLLARLKNHIDAVAGHYRGSVYAWDVVNEAIMDDGKYRTKDEPEADQRSQWHGILGTSYIAEAFRYAHAADPDAKLFYNDYRTYIPVKRQAIYELLKGLLAEGVPVHGVGLQGHLSIEPSPVEDNHGYYQSVVEMEKSIELFASLGLDVQITELDMSVYTPGMKYTPETFYTPATFTEAVEAKQAERYAAFFELFRKHAKVITGVTFWGIADDNTWLSEFNSGRKDFPMLFDEQHQPKLAFDRVMQF